MSTEERKLVLNKTVHAKVLKAFEEQLIDRAIAGFRGIPRREIKDELVFVDHTPYRVSFSAGYDFRGTLFPDPHILVEEVTKFIC